MLRTVKYRFQVIVYPYLFSRANPRVLPASCRPILIRDAGILPALSLSFTFNRSFFLFVFYFLNNPCLTLFSYPSLPFLLRPKDGSLARRAARTFK